MKSLALTLLVLLTASTFAQADKKDEATAAYADPSAPSSQSTEESTAAAGTSAGTTSSTEKSKGAM